MAGEGAEIARRDLGVLGPHDSIDEADGEVEAGGILQEVGEPLCGGVGTAVGDARGIDPGTDEFDASLGKWEIGHDTLKVSGSTGRVCRDMTMAIARPNVGTTVIPPSGVLVPEH